MKKTNIKRFFVLFCVLACVFSMTACTNTISSDSAKTSLKDMKVNQYASDMVQWAEDMLVYLDQTSDAQIKADGEAAKTLSYVNGKVYVVNMQGMNDKTIEFYNSWVKTREDLGALKSIDKEDVRVSDETGTLCTIAINATYETRTCAFELVIDDDFNLDSGAINPTYTTGEKMEKAVLNTVLGMGTVFIVLIFISYIISLLQHVNKSEQRNRQQKNHSRQHRHRLLKNRKTRKKMTANWLLLLRRRLLHQKVLRQMDW